MSRPSTLATQEVRFALAFTGGVSLAIWMGGVAQEVNLLVQASGRRRTPDQPEPGSDPDPVRTRYRRLLDLLDVQVAVDVLAGTSAGGINSALLGLANARDLDLGDLRDLWIRAGDLGELLRDPRQVAPPSLLKGDEQMLAELRSGIGKLLQRAPGPEAGRLTDVFVTTTLLTPETTRFSDDFGTQIVDADHHALFRFNERSLAEDAIIGPLALAARSSASFPAAFEPSYLAWGTEAALAADDGHPDMAGYTNITRSHWAADGGLLVNRPLAPLLRTVFDRGTNREVRRTLLYVVPTSAPEPEPVEERYAAPLNIAAAVMHDVTATLNQSIAADLSAIKEHNDRTSAASDTRLRIATLGARLRDDRPLCDAATWSGYQVRQGNWLVTPLVAELARQVATREGALPDSWRSRPGSDHHAAMRTLALDEATGSWPRQTPLGAEAVLGAGVALGRPAFDAAKATVLRLLRLGHVLADGVALRGVLSHWGTDVHAALPEPLRDDLPELVRTCLDEAVARSLSPGEAVPRLTRDYVAGQGSADQLDEAWRQLGGVLTAAADTLRSLAGSSPAAAAAPSPRPSMAQRRAEAAAELSTYLDFLGSDEPVRHLLELHVATRSVMPVLMEVEQPVELVQVSADTRTALAPSHRQAARKLTGLQLRHFGAFYKASWRANDWMWGRLDGCGWLVHVLLDPRRILAVLENDGVPVGQRAVTFSSSLGAAVGATVPDGLIAQLAFLDDSTQPFPVSLPEISTWAAQALQRDIAAEELPVLAAHVRADTTERLSPSSATWVAKVEQAKVPGPHGPADPHVVADLLETCPVPGERLDDERRRATPLFLRTVAHAAAVATSVGTGLRKPPASLRPVFATARAATQTAYVATNTAHGRRKTMGLFGLALIVASVLAMLTDITVLGVTGLAAFAAGALLVALTLGSKTVGALRVLLALALLLLAAAPWLPVLDTRLFDWLGDVAVPWLGAHEWLWPLLVLLVLLPPASTAYDLIRRGSRHQP